MSDKTSEDRQSSNIRDIPIRRVILNDASQMPSSYSTTPGGTLFSTTPGGTRIIYDRAFLMQCRNSPLAKSPPPNLPKIPGVTTTPTENDIRENGHDKPAKKEKSENPDEPQFEMDI